MQRADAQSCGAVGSELAIVDFGNLQERVHIEIGVYEMGMHVDAGGVGGGEV